LTLNTKVGKRVLTTGLMIINKRGAKMRYSELDNLDKEIKTNTEQDEQLYYLKYNQQVQYLFDIMKGDKNDISRNTES